MTRKLDTKWLTIRLLSNQTKKLRPNKPKWIDWMQRSHRQKQKHTYQIIRQHSIALKLHFFLFSSRDPRLRLQVPGQDREQGLVRHLRPPPQVRRSRWLRQVLHLPQRSLPQGSGLRTRPGLQHPVPVLRLTRKRSRMVINFFRVVMGKVRLG